MHLNLIAAFTLAALATPVSAASDNSSSQPPAPSICYYAGQEYSQWAKLPNGQICQSDGTWNFPVENMPSSSSSSSEQG